MYDLIWKDYIFRYQPISQIKHRLILAPQKHIWWISLTFSRWSRMYDTVAVMQSSICKIFGKYALIRWLMFFNTISRLFKIPCWRPKGRTLDKSKFSTAWMTAEWHSPSETEEQRHHIKRNISLLLFVIIASFQFPSVTVFPINIIIYRW